MVGSNFKCEDNDIKKILELIDDLRELYTNENIDLNTETINAKNADGYPKYADLKKTLTELETCVENKFDDAVNSYRIQKEENDRLNNVVKNSESQYSSAKNRKDNLQNQSAGTEELKRNVYDTGILDNMFVIYYFLSYGIIGTFIYKLLKQ